MRSSRGWRTRIGKRVDVRMARRKSIGFAPSKSFWVTGPGPNSSLLLAHFAIARRLVSASDSIPFKWQIPLFNSVTVIPAEIARDWIDFRWKGDAPCPTIRHSVFVRAGRKPHLVEGTIMSRNAMNGQARGPGDCQAAGRRCARASAARRSSRFFGFIISAVCLGGLQAQPALSSSEARSFLSPQTSQNTTSSSNVSRRLWQISLLTLAGANAMDVQSTLGKRELNPALAGSSGTLGAQGILLKSALTGGIIGIEYLITRGRSQGPFRDQPRSKLYRALAMINFVSTGVLTGVAIHNYTVPRTQP